MIWSNSGVNPKKENNLNELQLQSLFDDICYRALTP